MRLVAWSMTVDPDGAMHDWVDLPAGWRLVRVPTQEAVTLVGVRGYQEALVELCAAERVQLVVTHPPYDYLDEATAGRLRAAGAAVVGYAFDDAIVAGAYRGETRAALARAYDRYVTTEEVPWATRPLPPLPEHAAEHDVVLVGRAYPRRRALVDALRAGGVAVTVRGVGWPGGPVTRAEMLDLYARAAIVLTTADWEDVAVPMVKHRLLDTAALGAFQVTQEAPDLDRYFPPSEVPRWREADDLVALVRELLAAPGRRRAMAAAARARVAAEHSWTRRFPRLIAGLELREAEAPTSPSPLFGQLLVGLASRAEATGRIAAAEALWSEALERRPDDAAVLAGAGRCRRDLGDLDGAIELLRRAAAIPGPICARDLRLGIPPAGAGTGLGRLAIFPPAAEPTVFLVAALVERGDVAGAAAVLDAIRDPALARAVAATLQGDMPADIRARLARLGA